MNRYAYKIGKIYNLGRPIRNETKSMATIRHFLGDGDSWYTFEYAHCLPERVPSISLIFDHVDLFKHHITLLPYVVGGNVENEIKQDSHWQLCIQCGLQYEIVEPDPAIFEDSRALVGHMLMCDAVKLIILPCSDWEKLCADISRELKRVYGR